MFTVGLEFMMTVPSAEAEPHWLLLLTVTVKVPAELGVPEIVPVLPLSPLNCSPLDNVTALELPQLVAVTVTGLMAEPSHTSILLLERVTVGSGFTVMVPVVLASPQLVEVVTEMGNVPTAVGLPMIWPVVLSKLKPAGSPVMVVVSLYGEMETPSMVEP